MSSKTRTFHDPVVIRRFLDDLVVIVTEQEEGRRIIGGEGHGETQDRREQQSRRPTVQPCRGESHGMPFEFVQQRRFCPASRVLRGPPPRGRESKVQISNHLES